MLNNVVREVTERIEKRSEKTRNAYMNMVLAQEKLGRGRKILTCSNLAHAVASEKAADKATILKDETANIGIVSAYNDMLSAHCPYKVYPDAIKVEVAKHGATAQVAGCVPAMCDGVTQGQPGMDMSLFSRDIIAQSVAVSLSHNVFDGVLLCRLRHTQVPRRKGARAAHRHHPGGTRRGGSAGALARRGRAQGRQYQGRGRLRAGARDAVHGRPAPVQRAQLQQRAARLT